MAPRTRNVLVGIVAVVLLVTVVGPFVYINFIKEDAPPRATIDDVTTTTPDGASTSEVPQGIEGSWTVAEGSNVAYRISETLFGQDSEAFGQADGVTGELTIEGTTVTEATFEVDMATFESAESQRDNQFQGRIMEVAEFPTAAFVLSAPIELGSVPADGEEIIVTATGDLTLHGVTREITIDLTAKLAGTTFAADGRVGITFTDYDIDDPSGGPASVGDEGDLEVLLVFSR